MAQSAAQKAKAKSLTAEKKVKDAAKKVKESREAARDMEVTSMEAWLSPAEEEGVKLLLPSGKVCLARNPGMDLFIEQGMVPNRLLPLVQEAIREGRGLPPKQVEEISEDLDGIADVVLFANRVLCHCVLEPEVEMPPVWTDEDRHNGLCHDRQVGAPAKRKRQKGVLYADMVDLDDRLFILQWCVGGTKDLERFRQEQAAVVEDVLAVAGAPDET